MKVEELKPNKRALLRYRVNDSITVGFSNHAVHRMAERGTDPVSVINDMSGKTPRDWKKRGIIAKCCDDSYVKIITVFDRVPFTDPPHWERRGKPRW